MLNTLSGFGKIFGTGFAVGQLFPSILFAIMVKWLYATEPSTFLDYLNSLQNLDNSVDIILIAVGTAVVLLTANREIIRFFEGYGAGAVFKFRFWFPWAWINERRKFRSLDEDYAAKDTKRAGLNGELERLKAAIEAETNEKRKADLVRQKEAKADEIDNLEYEMGAILYTKASTLPEDLDSVLPTRFGNRIAAFEAYSRVVYGFDAIEGIERLQPHIQASQAESEAGSKSRVDLWVNLAALACVWFLFILYLTWGPGPSPLAWCLRDIVVAGICVFPFAFVAMLLATEAAFAWGATVKACIDLSLDKLAEDLGYVVPKAAEEEQEFWRTLSQHFLLRDPGTLSDLEKYRKKAPPPSPPAPVIRRVVRAPRQYRGPSGRP